MKFWILAFALITGASAFAKDGSSCVTAQKLASQLGCNNSSGGENCQHIQAIAGNLGCMGGASAGSIAGGNASSNFQELVLTNTFKSDQCAMAQVLDDIKKSQSDQCEKWLSRQKKDLGARYVTGSCTEACTECAPGMQKCATNALVHYRVDKKK